MKKNYINPTITIVDVKVEPLLAGSNTNFKPMDDGTGTYVMSKDINGSLGDGEEVDAAGYRSNLWGD